MKQVYSLLLWSFPCVVFSVSQSIDSISTRIVGGTQVTAGAFPYFVHLFNPTCGGSLIYPDIVLTAAHCTSFVGRIVYIGASTINGNGAGSLSRKVIASLVHPSFNATGNEENDIRLLKLETPSSAQLIQLNTNALIPAQGSKVDVIGFGKTSETSAVVSFNLNQVQVTVQDYDVCQSMENMNIIGDPMTQICAGELAGGKDSCDGDSGGPLLIAGTNIQVGIVSVGVGCARVNASAIYTKISAYDDFIQDGICELSSSPPASCYSPTPTSSPSVSIEPTVSASPTSFKEDRDNGLFHRLCR